MKIALVGNQNSGKTTLFNLLTGMNQKIGNWPGVTLERKEGIIKKTDFQLIDLPGIYSLSPYTMEEAISCDYLLKEKPDLIINVIDVNTIERSFYLTTQLLDLDFPMIIALNMTDILTKKGGRVDVNKLEQLLKVDVVSVSAVYGFGIKELIDKIKNIKVRKSIPTFSSSLESKINMISPMLEGENRRFIAIKLLEKDPRFINYRSSEIEEYLASSGEDDFEEVIASERYRFTEIIKTAVITLPPYKMTLTDKIDRILLNKYFAYPIFIVIMFLVYYIAVGLTGNLLGDILENALAGLNSTIEAALLRAGVSGWLTSLIVNGILTGIFAVLGFLPQIAVLFFFIAILETTGYLSRISFLLDKFFNRLGLSGRSLIPFIVGSGCSVPGIMAARTIENEAERKAAIILTPFIPCNAKLPIIALFAGFFFEKNRGLISASLYFLSILIIVISASIFKRFNQANKTSYISEMPPYYLPNFKYVFRSVGEKIFSFVKRAGSVILVGSVVIWLLLSFSLRLEYGVAIENSILAAFGNSVAWFFYPIVGKWSWAAGVTAIQGLVAKEQVVSSFSIIAGFSGDGASAFDVFTAPAFAFFTRASAYAFMAFNLFSIPCIGAIGAMRKELGSTKLVLKAALYQTVIAWMTSSLLFAVLSGFWGLL